MSLVNRVKNWERDLRASYNVDLSTHENRRRAQIYNLWFDHAILRDVWTNFHPVAPGAWRSNNPTHRRFAEMKRMGIRSVLNLRGVSNSAHYLLEEESCAELGLTLVNRPLHARQASGRGEILSVLEAFRHIPKPFVMHCKSGADRAGFSAAIYLLAIENRPVCEAKAMLAAKYVHFRWTKTGILDHILDAYEQRTLVSPIGFEDWVKEEYNPAELQAEFDARGQETRSQARA